MAYLTKQKTAILDHLKLHKDKHYTVEELHLSLLGEGTCISIATLYRTVDSLAEKGFLRKYYTDNMQKASYQYVDNDDCLHHFHMICTSCNRLYHLNCEEAKIFADHIEKEHDFDIDFSKVIFYGICKECKEKMKNEH